MITADQATDATTSLNAVLALTMDIVIRLAPTPSVFPRLEAKSEKYLFLTSHRLQVN